MFFYLISLFFLGTALYIKYYSNKDINYFMILAWFIVLFIDFVFFLITKQTNLNIRGMLICITLSFFVIIFSKKSNILRKQHIIINKYIFYGVYVLFLFSSIIMIKNYVNLYITFNGNGTDILLNKDMILENGFVSYSFTLGIPLMLLLPYVKSNKIVIRIILFNILIAYLLFPKRSYFIIAIFILIYHIYCNNYEKIHRNLKKKINKKNILLIIIIGMIGFHYTQVSLNKSIYNNTYMGTVDKYTEIESIFLDTAIYTNGNISNSDKYIDFSNENTNKPFLNNTLHAIYSFTKNFGFPKSKIDVDNIFIKTGNFSTNTVNMFAYFYADLGFIYMILAQFLITLIFSRISERKTIFSQIIYPLILYSAVMSFRENNFMFIYFYITCLVVYVALIKFKY